MKKLTLKEEIVYNAVPRGRKNAVCIKYLENKLDMDGRKIRKIFEEMCIKGYIVCNLMHGYFLPECAEDYDIYYAINNSYYEKFKIKLRSIKAARMRWWIKTL